MVKKDIYNAKIKNIEEEIADITNLATNTILNAKINEIKNEIPSITNLATIAALTTVENEIHNTSNVVKKSNYSTNISEIINHDHDKCTANPEIIKLATENFAAILAQAF